MPIALDRKQGIPLILGAAVFLLGGFDALYQGDLLVGTANLVAGSLNLAALTIVRSLPRLTGVLVNVLNASVAGVMVVASILAGKHYIQYAWAVALLFFVGAAVIQSRRNGGSVEQR